MENTYLIVGLGNPGEKYARTRHNVGFMALERFAARHGRWKLEEKFTSRLARFELDGKRVLCCEPQTYMNDSGVAVQAVAGYFKVATGHLLVVVDDADLPFGELRMRAEGSPGGHHGLESIEQHLGTRQYARLRIGIGREESRTREITNHVLGQFAANEVEWLDEILDRAAKQISCWLVDGIRQAMNQFNGAVKAPMPKES
jgi:peptidyl-tRNA hydrolase, PTH1 family